MPDVRPTLDDMVFENRNREYGSYHLRKKFYARLGIGFITSLLVLLVIVMGYFWYLTKAGDENVYYYESSLPMLKTVQTSLLTQEELDSYMGKSGEPNKPIPEEIQKKGPASGFVVTENASPDTFKAELDNETEETPGNDLGLMVNDSTAFGGILTGEGLGTGGIYDRIPEFPGGNATRYVEMNLRYPALAMKQKIHGVVIVSFVVSKTGHVTNVKVERSVNPIIDEEAVKTIKNMPPWKPGMLNGKPVNFIFTMPINFVPLS